MHSRAVPIERRRAQVSIATAAIVAAVLFWPASLVALSNAFTYQGQLEQDGTPVDGGCDFLFSLFDEESGGNQVGATIPAASQRVSGGLFSVEIDFGPGMFDGLDRWLEIRVRCPQGSGGYAVLGPREHLTATPYALFAPSAGDLTCVGCVDSAALADGAVTSAQIAGGTIQQSDLAFTPGTVTSITAGNGLTGGTITTSGTIAANIGTGPGSLAAGDHSHASTYWTLSGNAGTNGATSFLGTTDGQPLEVRVNGARALRIEPDSTSPRLIGGHAANAASPGAYGATIAGGGATANGNEVTDIYGSVGGGSNNRAGNGGGTVDDGRHAVVGGGATNTAGGTGATVCGGQANAAGGTNASIAGGQGNYASAIGASVGGGWQNDASGEYATIGGGANNRADEDGAATIAGGASNRAGLAATVGGGSNNNAIGRASTIGGGSDNSAGRKNASVGGGAFNEAIGDYATIAGGTHNRIEAGYATIGGGGPAVAGDPTASNNRVYDEFGTIGGGGGNRAGSDDDDMRSATFATVGGGESNYAEGDHATIGGGQFNGASGGQATIAGGYKNIAGVNASVGGGSSNVADGIAATIGGGAQNSAAYLATVGGGYANGAGGSFGTIAGGGPSNPADLDTRNEVSDDYGTIGGGGGNRAGSDDGNTTNAAYATVGGGKNNRAEGGFATVPGGSDNLAAGDHSFAAGTQAKAYNRGCVVITDSHAVDEPCINDDRFVFRVTNAFYIWTDVDHVSGVVLPTGGTAWAPLSDRNAKENFQPVDGREVLSRLAAVPIQSWNLKTQPAEIRHIGPVAQDFAAAFGFGEDDTHINTIDADGVAFAAIQGLYQLLLDKEARIEALEARLAALEARQP